MPTAHIVGCGAIVENFYAGSISLMREAGYRLAFVDYEESRARQMAQQFGDASASREMSAAADDLAIICTPNRFHFEAARGALLAGAHVLVEKPMVERFSDGLELLDIARRSHRILMANNTRRLFPTTVAVKDAIREGSMGKLLSIEYTEGGIFNWESRGGGYFRSGGARMGLIYDRGSHVMDLLCHWTDGERKVESSMVDSTEGPEGLYKVKIRAGDVVAKVHSTWLAKLENRVKVVFDSGEMEFGVYDWGRIERTAAGRRKRELLRGSPRQYAGFGNVLIQNFIDAVRGKELPATSGSSVLDGIRLLEDVYDKREALAGKYFRLI